MDLEKIPDLALIRIFQHLGTSDLMNCRAVNSRWFNILRSRAFRRIQKLSFSNCVISEGCPPLSLFRTTSTLPFFKELHISTTELFYIKYPLMWKICWEKLAKNIEVLSINENGLWTYTHKNIGQFLNPALWPKLVELTLPDQFIVSLPYEYPNVKTLRLVVGLSTQYDSKFNEDLQKKFSNLEQLYCSNLSVHAPKLTGDNLKKLKEIHCTVTDFQELENIEQLEALGLFYRWDISETDVKIAQRQLAKQTQLKNLTMHLRKLDLFNPTFTQITDLRLVHDHENFGGFGTLQLLNILEPLKNLRSLVVSAPCQEEKCFFGHIQVTFPQLEEVFFDFGTEDDCDECWENWFKSLSNLKIVALPFVKQTFKNLHHLTSLKCLKIDMKYKNGDNVGASKKWHFPKVKSLYKLEITESEQKSVVLKKILDHCPQFEYLKAIFSFEWYRVREANPNINRIPPDDPFQQLMNTTTTLKILHLDIYPNQFSCFPLQQAFYKMDSLMRVIVNDMTLTRDQFESVCAHYADPIDYFRQGRNGIIRELAVNKALSKEEGLLTYKRMGVVIEPVAKKQKTSLD